MDFVRVDRPIFPPHVCQVCGLADGPLVDTLIEQPLTGHRVYLCRRCVFDATRALGGLDAEQRAELERELDKALGRIAALKEEVAEETRRRVVPLADVIALVASQQQPTVAAGANVPTPTGRRSNSGGRAA